MNKFYSLFIVGSLLVTFGCNSHSSHNQSDSQNENAHKEQHADCSHAHWSYEGEEGPENWKDICPGYSACGGNSQAPINIITSDATSNDSLFKLTTEYNTSNVSVVNNGHTVQFNVSGENYLMIGEKKYKLLQFHYHALSEHKINDAHSPIEVHFVHKNNDTDFAVLGFMFKEGKEYDLFSKYLTQFPTEKGDFVSEDVIDLKELIPSNLSYYNYSGSLTTPPCSEVVNWYVLQTPQEASAEQITEFSKILHNNYRPTKPLNERKVFSYTE